MAAEHKMGIFFFLNKKFLLFCLYIAAYVMLRLHGEIVFQQVAVPAGNGGVETYSMASAHPGIPYWRQQLWRALFSAPMVAEEEGQPVIMRVRGLIGTARERSGGGSLLDRAVEAGRSLLLNQAPQPQNAPQGLNPGERMIYDPRAQ